MTKRAMRRALYEGATFGLIACILFGVADSVEAGRTGHGLPLLASFLIYVIARAHSYEGDAGG